MNCCLGCSVLLIPRLILLQMFLFTDHLSNAFKMNLWPFLGFFFLPYTTLSYTFAMNERGGLEGPYLFMVVGAFIIDLYTTRIRVNRTESSGVRFRVNKMKGEGASPRAVDAQFIDIDKDK